MYHESSPFEAIEEEEKFDNIKKSDKFNWKTQNHVAESQSTGAGMNNR